uniref:Ig-like domain-containing protein n=1 Tax=Terrapene triunguis TaxID=2587831 RepID=A0A674JWE4_9SAUR
MQNLRIHWHVFREGEGSVVHSYYAGADRLQDQAGEFQGRTHLSLRTLSQGWVSLGLTNVQPADSGEYRCIVVDTHYAVTGDVILQVSVPYETPQISVLYRDGNEVRWQCEARGGYPEAEVTWHDGNGKQLMQSEPTEFLRTREGVCIVQSILTASVHGARSVCCSVLHKLLRQNTSICHKLPGSRLAIKYESYVNTTSGLD